MPPISVTMKFISLFLLLMTIVVHGYGQTVTSEDCATSVHGIFMRGQGTGDDYNTLSAMSNLMLENINGSTSVALPYDHGDWDKWIAMLNGSLLLVEYVADYVSSCPDSKIFILGYSLGADALMNSLCGTSSLFLPPAPILDVAYKSNSKPFLTFYQERCCSNCNYGWAFWKRQILFRSSFFLSLSQARLTFTA